MKLLAVVAVALVLVAVAVFLLSGGQHGPGMHGSLPSAAPDALRLA